MPRITRTSLSSRRHPARREPEKVQETIRLLRKIVEAGEETSYGFLAPKRVTPAFMDRSILDELIDIHCTPWGVEVREPSFGWHELANDWSRVGGYIRNAMAELTPPPPPTTRQAFDSTSAESGGERGFDEET